MAMSVEDMMDKKATKEKKVERPEKKDKKVHPFLKDMIELSRTIKEADEIITQHGCVENNYRVKLNLLKEHFPVECSHLEGLYLASEARMYTEYTAILAAIIDEKWH